MSYPQDRNPFFAEGDDDPGFSKSVVPENGRMGAHAGGYSNPYADTVSDEEFAKPPQSRYEQMQDLKKESMNRQLAGTQRALTSIYDSESMGTATAEVECSDIRRHACDICKLQRTELIHQKEQLDNTEKNLDKINQDMKTSQRHLTSIKSVFGGIKNWWAGSKKDNSPEPSQKLVEAEHSQLQQTLDTNRRSAPHPGARIRSEDCRGFYDDDDELDGKFMAGAPSSSSSSSRKGGYSTLSEERSFKGQLVQSGHKEHDAELEDNLDLMSAGMTRLKGLAIGLGSEIETQNDQIERITGKTDRGDTKIRDQNRQMRQILGK